MMQRSLSRSFDSCCGVRSFLALVLLVAYPAQAGAQCLAETMGPASHFTGAPDAALAGDRVAAVVAHLNSTDRRLEILERDPQGTFEVVESVSGFPGFPGFVQAMSFDGQRLQFYVTSTPPSIVELEKDAAGVWQAHETSLTGYQWFHGEALARDGDRWAAISAGDHETLHVDVLERNAGGRLAVVATTSLETRRAFGFGSVGTVVLDGDQMAVRSGAESRGAVQVLERRANGQWRRTGHLVQPVGTSSAYGGGVDLQGDRAVVVRQVAHAQGASVVHVYERDASSPVGWTLTQEMRGADSAYLPGFFRHIACARLDGDRLIVGGTNEGVSQVLRVQAGGSGQFVPETTIDGFGGQLVVGPDFLLGTNRVHDRVLIERADLTGRQRVAVCLPAGDIACVDPSHSLCFHLSQRQLFPPYLGLVADVLGAAPGSHVFLLGSDVFGQVGTPAGALCIGPSPRRTSISLSAQGGGYHTGIVEVTRMPIQGGLTSAMDGEDWTFQAAALSAGGRALSSAVLTRIRL